MMIGLDAGSRSWIARVGAWCFAHRRAVFAVWLLALIAATGFGRIAGNQFTDNFNGGHTQAEQAQALLRRQFPAYAAMPPRSSFTRQAV